MNPNWVLTAAHCVDSFRPRDMSVQYSSTKISPGSSNVADVDNIFPHEDYDFFSLENDIALIKLSSPVDIEEEYFVNLPTLGQDFETGTPAVLAGWGMNGSSGQIQETLQKVTLQVYSPQDCQKIHILQVHLSNICGGVVGGGQGKYFLRGWELSKVT